LKTAKSNSWPEQFIGPSHSYNRERQFCVAGAVMLKDRENILNALREKPLKAYEVMKRANLSNEEACQSLLLKMRDEGLVKFDIHKGQWTIR
jgi:hypothetical protein